MVRHQQCWQFDDVRYLSHALSYQQIMLGTKASDELVLLGVVLDESSFHTRQCIAAIDKLKLPGFNTDYLHEASEVEWVAICCQSSSVSV